MLLYLREALCSFGSGRFGGWRPFIVIPHGKNIATGNASQSNAPDERVFQKLHRVFGYVGLSLLRSRPSKTEVATPPSI